MFVQMLDTLPVTIAERRRAARRRPTQDTVCHLTALDGAEAGCGLVWNVSTTGISMLLHIGLEPGALLGAELSNAAGARLRVGLSVVHLTRLRTGDYVLGGQFSEALDEDELRPFVA
jgi:hypothetical protein